MPGGPVPGGLLQVAGSSRSCCSQGEGSCSLAVLLPAAVLLAAVEVRSCWGGRSQGRLLAGSAAVGRLQEVALLLLVAAGKGVVQRALHLGTAVGRSRQVLHSRCLGEGRSLEAVGMLRGAALQVVGTCSRRGVARSRLWRGSTQRVLDQPCGPNVAMCCNNGNTAGQCMAVVEAAMLWAPLLVLAETTEALSPAAARGTPCSSTGTGATREPACT